MALTSQSAPDFVAAPATIGGVRVVPNQRMFWLKTETNHDPIRTVSIDSPVFGRYARWDMPKKGLHTLVQVIVEGTLTVAKGTGAVTARDNWAHGLIDRLQYRANGTDVHSISGMGLEMVRHIDFGEMDMSVVDEGLSAIDLNTNGSYDFKLTYFLQIAKDQGTDIGGLLAESDGTQIEMIATMAAKNDLFAFTADADVTLSANIKYQATWRELGRDSVDGQDVIYVPELSRIHMMYETSRDITSTGATESPVLRANGNLHRVIAFLRNNNANIDPRTLDWIKFGYGVNQTPRHHEPPHHLLAENVRNYRSTLPYNAFAFDFDAENPVRDATRPRSVTEMLVQAGIPSGTSLSNAKFRCVQQSIIAARNSTTVTVPDGA